MTSSSRQRCVLVTGAGSGIGHALSRHLLARGHLVIATDVRKPTLEGEGIQTFALDVTSERAIAEVMGALAGHTPDVLINNAGLQHVESLESFPADKWQHLIAVMLTGAAMLTRAVLPSMRAGNFGRIINIGSIHSLVASPYKSAYVAAKHGLVGFSKTIALEIAEHDITINTICPSYVKTPLVDAQIDALARKHGLPADRVAAETMLKPMPKRRFIEMDELAGTVDFLLSPAARNITGQCITLDGGWTIQ